MMGTELPNECVKKIETALRTNGDGLAQVPKSIAQAPSAREAFRIPRVVPLGFGAAEGSSTESLAVWQPRPWYPQSSVLSTMYLDGAFAIVCCFVASLLSGCVSRSRPIDREVSVWVESRHSASFHRVRLECRCGGDSCGRMNLAAIVRPGVSSFRIPLHFESCGDNLLFSVRHDEHDQTLRWSDTVGNGSFWMYRDDAPWRGLCVRIFTQEKWLTEVVVSGENCSSRLERLKSASHITWPSL